MDDFNQLIETADELLSAYGFNDIYEETREAIESSMEHGHPKDAHESEPVGQWYYRVAGEIYGPFPSNEMRCWESQGYFASGQVQVQKAVSFDAKNDSLWLDIKDVKL